MKKTYCSVALVVSLMFSSISPIPVKANSTTTHQDELTFVTSIIPEQADEYAKESIVGLMKNVIAYPEMYGVSSGISYDNYVVGEAYTIFNIDCNQQVIDNHTYYYPVFYNDEYVLTLSIMNMKQDEWSASIGKNELGDLYTLSASSDSPILLYTYDDILYAENDSQVSVITDIKTDKQMLMEKESFVNKSYKQKIADIETCNFDLSVAQPYSDFVVTEENRVQPISLYYTPGFSVNQQNEKTLDIWNYRDEQRGYYLCWACCVSTIVDYRLGTKKYNKFDIADTMDIGYYIGATIEQTTEALNKFGQSYTSTHNTISYNSVVNSINNKKGIVAGCYAYEDKGYIKGVEGHSVLIAGYYSSGTNYIVFYDSGTDSMKTSTVINNNNVTSPISFTFTYNGYTHRWYYTAY